MIVNIYITGQIGNTVNQNGEIIERGVTLLDVVEQVAAHPNEAIKKFIINSPGGYVSVGTEIADFISTIPNALTHGTIQVASIATRIFLAVEKQNRSIEKDTDFMIHNPWVGGVAGDAEELKRIAEGVEKEEEELESFYAKSTGLDKGTLSSLMRYDTTLTPEQCVKLGFAGSITEKELSPILALNYNTNQKEMTNKDKGVIESILASLGLQKAPKTAEKNKEGRNIVAIQVVTDNGTLENDLETIEVNDEVLIDGQPAPTGNYTAEDGTVYEVVDGVVMVITMPTEEDDVEALKSEIETLKATNAELTSTVEANAVEIQERDKNTAEIKAQIEALAQLKSEGEPAKKETVFPKKEVTAKRKSFAESKEAMKK